MGCCKESMEKNWVPGFSIMTSLVNGLAKGEKVEEAKKSSLQKLRRSSLEMLSCGMKSKRHCLSE